MNKDYLEKLTQYKGQVEYYLRKRGISQDSINTVEPMNAYFDTLKNFFNEKVSVKQAASYIYSQYFNN